MRGVLNVGVIYGNNDIVLLNAGGLGRFHNVFYRHAPPGAVFYRYHVNAHFGESQRLAVQRGGDDAFSEQCGNGEGHATAVSGRVVAFRLYDGMHDADDFTLVVEEAATGVAAAGGDIGLNEPCINRLKERVRIAQVAERHGGAPAHGIPDGKDILPWLHVTGSKGHVGQEFGAMCFSNAVDDDVHEGAVTNQVCGNLMEVGRQHMDLFLNDGAGCDILLFRRMAGGHDVPITEVKPRATH